MKILVLLSRVPYPLEKGDKLRAFNQIKRLGTKHEVSLFALNDKELHPDAVEQLKPFCRSIKVIRVSRMSVVFNLFKSLFSGLPFQVGYFYNSQAKNILQNYIEARKPDVIYCQLIRMAPYVEEETKIPVVLDYMDAFSAGAKRWAERKPFFFRLFLKAEYKRALRYEKKVFELFSQKVIISEQDKKLIIHPRNDEITVIPNGVDMEFFRPLTKEKKYDLLFTGNMNYPPNIESAIFIVKKVLPLVWEKIPSVNLLIAGADPAPEVNRLASANVKVSGWVEDIRESYISARVFVAPMFMSIGMQNKLLEAMAMKLPCITSSLASNALQAVPDESVLVADKASAFAACICALLENSEKARSIANKGYAFVQGRYDWDTINRRLEEVLRSAVQKKRLAV